MLTWGRRALNESVSSIGLDNLEGLMEELREMIHVREFAATQRISRRFDIKVKQMGYHIGGLKIKRVEDFKKEGGLVRNGEGSFHINQRVNNGAHKLEDLEVIEMPGTWNVISLEFYPN